MQCIPLLVSFGSETATHTIISGQMLLAVCVRQGPRPGFCKLQLAVDMHVELLIVGSEESPASRSNLTAEADTASLQTGATTRSGAVVKEQLASAQAVLRRRDRRIAALSRQVAQLRQQLAAAGSSGDAGGELAVYQAPGALAPVGE